MSTRQVIVTFDFCNPEIEIPIDMTGCDLTTTNEQLIEIARTVLLKWCENAKFEVI
jgi:hypothetical protein